MGQIKDDFIEWAEEHRPILSTQVNIKRLGGHIEDFLLWKAKQIKQDKQENEGITLEFNEPLVTSRRPKHKTIDMTEEERKLLMEILGNTKSY